MEKLHEENRVQQARDLATLQEIQNERIEREKEVHTHLMDIQRKNQEDRALLHEQMMKKQEQAHAMLFLSMKQRQDDMHQYQQMLSAIPRALSSEQQTSKLMLLKTKLYEITSSTDDSIVTFDMAHSDFKKKSTAPNFAALEKSASEMNECVKTLNRTVTETIAEIASCTSVVTSTRSEWRELLKQLQTLTSSFTRTSTRMLGLVKRKAVTVESIDNLMKEFDLIKGHVYDLPNLDEGSVLGMIEQKQSEIMNSQQNRLNMLTLNGTSSLPSIAAAP
ncbi:hypothetical protein PRIPAC_79840 [Pristionchus pacificus]|uniref:Uncharacterized protein n=1 Tax=Pristionchus pacificus TaxID=54126 RepID=A0A2A6CBD6_PRIPA|nr:hypothetical protein PRIPAC_79840 [Pristionchus pacificus]|eukprot:PDM75535.1 hypothetical protein PRIPAC_42712 [Pristionchus pacificus]